MNYKKKKKLPSFVAISRKTLQGEEWRELYPPARDIYLQLKRKYVGYNNGQLVLHYSELKGMYSSSTISKAFKELENNGWVERERIGGLYRFHNEYRLTGKYDDALINYGL